MTDEERLVDHFRRRRLLDNLQANPTQENLELWAGSLMAPLITGDNPFVSMDIAAAAIHAQRARVQRHNPTPATPATCNERTGDTDD